MHDLVRSDYLNEVAALTGFLGLRFNAGDLNDVYIDDEALGAFIKNYRTHYKIRTVWERYLDPQSPQKVEHHFECEKGFEEWFSQNTACLSQLNELVAILNTTNDMAVFRGAYNEMWHCLRPDKSSLVSLCEVKPEAAVHQPRDPKPSNKKHEGLSLR